jgi:hypothetical protein
MTRDTRRWIALLAGPAAVIGLAIAGAVLRPAVWAPDDRAQNPDDFAPRFPDPRPFEALWRDRVLIPLWETGVPPQWLNHDTLIRMQVPGLAGGFLPGAKAVRTERISPPKP